jgi:uncharacterized protein
VNPDFVGAGWAFPVTTDATGDVALVAREREIEQAIRIILGTARGERPMRPEFGCRIHDHVFGSTNGATAGQISYDVREALERWEPRISVRQVDVVFDEVLDGKVYVDVHYLIADNNDPRNLVFPFYVIPDHEPDAVAAGRTALTTGSEP